LSIGAVVISRYAVVISRYAVVISRYAVVISRYAVVISRYAVVVSRYTFSIFNSFDISPPKLHRSDTEAIPKLHYTGV
jgi:hypothetical protein